MIRNYLLLFFVATLVYSLTGCKKETSEIHLIPAFKGDTTTLNGLARANEGINASYSVFMDFSRGIQTRELRNSWDFGVYCGAENRLIINHSMGAAAIALNKTSLADVGAADTSALEKDGTLLVNQTNGNLKNVDPVSGDFAAYLSGTVFAEVKADAESSNVYIVNKGTAGDTVNTPNKRWYKMKVYLVDRGYKIDYALINETTASRFSTTTIAKDDSFNFRFAAFSSNRTNFEPARANWDIEWGWSTYKNAAGNAVTVPDFVLINFGGGTRAAEVKFPGLDAAATAKKYEDYVFADQTGVTYSAERDVIGTKWRNLDPAAGPSSVNKDRFYLIKDGEGNVYKLRFLSFIPNDGGQRGRPRIEYRLLGPNT
ncbi:HmuY family protein [Pedobacter antarcticus]|uniref:HmuY family protein n=1 Tax=Pedobacter antarcticus TaxID=34086 RepID=UPI001C593E87|nr:HmuY family protein [Pedobacter antarcticus]